MSYRDTDGLLSQDNEIIYHIDERREDLFSVLPSLRKAAEIQPPVFIL